MQDIKKKIVAIITALTVSMWIAGPAFGATADELQAQINALLAQLQTLQTQLAGMSGGGTAGTGACSGITFSRNLVQGMTGTDVKCLQAILNSSADTKVAASGSGSPGSETTYFGSLTKAAVVKFQEKYASEVLTPVGLTAGTGYVGAKTRAKLATMLGSGGTGGGVIIPGGPGLTVTLAANNPAAGTIVGGSAITELARLTFTNGDSSEVKVSTLKLKRIGISDDSTLPSLYLFDGYKRIGDEGTLSSGVVTFNVAGGIFTVPAGGSRTITVRADVASSTGQTVGVQLAAATDITSNAGAVNGLFPLSGNLMSIAAASTAGTVNLSTVYPVAGTDANIEATNDFIAWQNTLTAQQQDAKLEYLRLTQIGSISATDLNNIRLDINGTVVANGQLVAGLSGQDLVFDLSAAPITIVKGQVKTLKVFVDIVGGASKTMKFGLEKKADIFLKDTAYGCYIAVSGTVPSRTGLQTITQGTITLTRSSASPAGNVVNNASNLSLAKFSVKANGEEIKINSLKVKIYTTTSTVYSLRNGILLLDGVQVGGTAQILASTSSSATGTYTTFNVYQKISAGQTKTLEVKADSYGCTASACAANGLSDGNFVAVQIIGSTAEDNAQGMSSLGLIDAPSSMTSGNQLTVGSASLSLVANPAYGNQTVSVGSDTKIGSYKLTAGGYDSVSISALTVVVSVGSGLALTDLSNLYLKLDGTAGTVKGSVAASNNFSVNKTLDSSKTMSIDVWATIAASASGAVSTTLAVSATKATDGSDLSVGATAGQIITSAGGQINVAKSSDSPDAAIVNGLSTDIAMAKFTYNALYEGFTVNTIQITATTSATSSSATANTTDDYVNIYLKYKNAEGLDVTSDPVPFTGTNATFTNLTLYVPTNGSSKVTVYGNMNGVAVTGYANSGDGPQLGLTYWKGSSGSQPTASGTTDVWGNQMVLYKSSPTVAIKAGQSTTLSNGTDQLYAVELKANSKGDVGFKKINFNVQPGMSTSTDTIGTFKFYRGSTDISNYVTITQKGSGSDLKAGNLSSVSSATTVVVTFTNEEVIAADTSQTYYLKATVTGVDTVGENIQTYVLSDASYAAPNVYASTTASNFVWTDRSYPSITHGTATSDWDNGYLVATLPTDNFTLSR